MEGPLKVRFKDAHDKDRDSDENIVKGWKEEHYRFSPRDELCESKFPKETVVPRLPGQEAEDQEEGS
jgi:hypothetical protein